MTKQKFTIKDTEKIASLANVTLLNDEKETLTTQLEETLESVDILNELDTNEEGTSQVTGLSNVFRNDEIKKSFTQKEALSNAKKTYNGYFEVPSLFTTDYEETT
jgi:aspartyl/glutamyl-tRNA(Asn/Gln) amidotransferase C subunit